MESKGSRAERQGVMVSAQILTLLQEVIGRFKDQGFSTCDILRPLLLPARPSVSSLRSNYHRTELRSTLSISPAFSTRLFRLFQGYPDPPLSLSAQSTFCSKIPIKFCCPRSPGCNSRGNTCRRSRRFTHTPGDHWATPAFRRDLSPHRPFPTTETLPRPQDTALQPRAGRPPLGSVPSSVPRQPWVASQRSPAAPARRSCISPSFILRRRCHWRGDLCARPRRALSGLTCARAAAAAAAAVAARSPDSPARPGEPGPGLRAAGLQEQQRRHRHQLEAMVRRLKVAAELQLRLWPGGPSSRNPEPEVRQRKSVCLASPAPSRSSRGRFPAGKGRSGRRGLNGGGVAGFPRNPARPPAAGSGETSVIFLLRSGLPRPRPAGASSSLRKNAPLADQLSSRNATGRPTNNHELSFCVFRQK